MRWAGCLRHVTIKSFSPVTISTCNVFLLPVGYSFAVLSFSWWLFNAFSSCHNSAGICSSVLAADCQQPAEPSQTLSLCINVRALIGWWFVAPGFALRVEFVVIVWQCLSCSRSQHPLQVKVNTALSAVGCRAAAQALLNHTSITQGL